MTQAVTNRPGGTILNRMNEFDAHADDLVLLVKSGRECKGAFVRLEEVAEGMGLNINEEITKCMVLSENQTEIEVDVDLIFNQIEILEHFKYFGTMVTNDNYIAKEIETRFAAGNRTYYSLEK
ncbi:hypothetical protein J437_LFUL008440 [Ladona fulva]|uniref:Uncharacterized protein n=1 Tax=Ladona fulva TaxID=123851 RepID=A0A8K0P3U8_LADFU|nr:hypothetical protein J437_LFUL008440 [Ladona fulva]